MTDKNKGQRGKFAEAEVKKALDELNKGLTVAYHRMPDARAARGALAKQPADFLIAAHGKAYFLEVKETKSANRLAKDKLSQLAVLHKFDMAGITGGVLVHHTETGLWRFVPAEFLEIGQPSWDLRNYPAHPDCTAALMSSDWF